MAEIKIGVSKVSKHSLLQQIQDSKEYIKHLTQTLDELDEQISKFPDEENYQNAYYVIKFIQDVIPPLYQITENLSDLKEEVTNNNSLEIHQMIAFNESDEFAYKQLALKEIMGEKMVYATVKKFTPYILLDQIQSLI